MVEAEGAVGFSVLSIFLITKGFHSYVRGVHADIISIIALAQSIRIGCGINLGIRVGWNGEKKIRKRF
jgi:hypothetical protein